MQNLVWSSGFLSMVNRNRGKQNGFSPGDLVGLKLWLDGADSGTIIDSDGNVSQWNDKSSEGNDVEQIGGADQPNTGTATINGVNVLVFDGDSEFLRRVTFIGGLLNQPNTIYIVWEPITLPSVLGKLIDSANIADIDTRHAVDAIRTITNDQWSMFAGNSLFGSSRPIGIPVITSLIFNEAFSEGYLNGFLDMSGDVGLKTFEGITIAANFQNVTSNHSNVKVGEIIVKNGLSDTTERLAVENYLSNKWGISLFNPSQITGLNLWLDATDKSTIIDSGGNVSAWNDKSGEGNDAIQIMGSMQPQTEANTINGLNVLTFNGDTQPHQLILPRVVDTDWSIFIVYRPLVAGESSANWFSGDGLFDMEVPAVQNDFGLSLGVDADLLAGVRTVGTTIVKNTLGIDVNYIGVFTRVSSSGETKLYVNGSTAVTGTAGTGTMNAANRITIGSLQTDIKYFDGYIGEIITYDNVLSEKDKNKVEEYLSNKWLIGLSSPFAFGVDFSSDFS